MLKAPLTERGFSVLVIGHYADRNTVQGKSLKEYRFRSNAVTASVEHYDSIVELMMGCI